MKRIIFDDEITIWWDLDKFPKADNYTLYLDGSKHGETQKTHYTFKDLQENTTYQIRVEAYSSNGSIEEEILEIQTKCKKKDIDVTKAPYCAVGDGKTINTQALQKALDDCSNDEITHTSPLLRGHTFDMKTTWDGSKCNGVWWLLERLQDPHLSFDIYKGNKQYQNILDEYRPFAVEDKTLPH